MCAFLNLATSKQSFIGDFMNMFSKILSGALLVVAATAYSNEYTSEQLVACNQKTGVIATKIKDSYDCDEPVNVLTPVVMLYKYIQKPDSCKIMMLGLEHRYEKPTGINTRIHLSSMKQSDDLYYHFQVEGSYKFLTQTNTCVYPTAAISWTRMEVNPIKDETSAYIWKNCLHVGLGIEKSIQDLLLLGIRGHLIRDLDNRSFGEFDQTFVGTNNAKSTAFRITPYIHISLFGKGVFEVEPYYGKCFKDRFEEMGCKIAYSVAF